VSGFLPIPTDVPVYESSYDRAIPADRLVRERYVIRSAAELAVKHAPERFEARLVFIDDRTEVGHFHPWGVEVKRVRTQPGEARRFGEVGA
jgi:hypothetical protein